MFFVFTYGEEGTTTLVFFDILTWVGTMIPSLFGVIPCLLVYPRTFKDNIKVSMKQKKSDRNTQTNKVGFL